MELRDEVLRFAELMEGRLREHDEDKGEEGWRNSPAEWLSARLVQECGELLEALADGADPGEECADVANFAMMIADVHDCLGEEGEKT